MAWSAYSTLLAPGDIVTAAHVAELLAAFDERMRAVQLPSGISSWSIDTGAQETLLRGSGLITHRVYVESSGTVTQTTLNALLQSLVNYFYRTSDIEDGVSTLSAYTYAELEADTLAALTAAGAPITALNATVDNAGYWNFHREALRLLSWVALGLSARNGLLKIWSPTGVTPEQAVADYAALEPAVSFSPSQVYVLETRGEATTQTVDLWGENQVFEISLRSVSSYSSGWNLAIFHQSPAVFPIDDYSPLASEMLVGSTSLTFPALATADAAAWRQPNETAAVTETGTLTVTAGLVGWEDGSAHLGILAGSAWEPLPWVGDPTREVRRGSCQLDADAAAAKPSWVYG